MKSVTSVLANKLCWLRHTRKEANRKENTLPAVSVVFNVRSKPPCLSAKSLPINHKADFKSEKVFESLD